MGDVIALKPVDGVTLKDRIYDELRTAILAMDIYDHAVPLRLDEREMAAQLGISRTPLREALVRLENEGIVEIRSRRGVYVVRRAIDEVVELVTVWAALESMAARLACVHASDEDIAELARIGRSYTSDRARMQIDEYSRDNIRFHRRILVLSGCGILTEMGNELFAKLEPVRRHAMRDTSRTDRSIVDHSNIVDALMARDADRADRLVRDHTMQLGSYISRNWRSGDGRVDQNGG